MLSQTVLSHAALGTLAAPPPQPWPTPAVNRPQKCGPTVVCPLQSSWRLSKVSGAFSTLPHQHHIVPILERESREHMLDSELIYIMRLIRMNNSSGAWGCMGGRCGDGWSPHSEAQVILMGITGLYLLLTRCQG